MHTPINTVGKTPVIGILDRNTNKVFATVVGRVKRKDLEPLIYKRVKIGSKVFTDDNRAYSRLKKDFVHKFLKYSRSEYVRQDEEGLVYTNAIESVWASLRRAEIGVYHKISKKHRERYIQEVVGRRNINDLDTQEQARVVIRGMIEKRITFADLTEDNGLDNGLGGSRKWKKAA